MSHNLQAVRGMKDHLPAEMPHWHRVEAVIREVLSSFGYSEIRFPIVEKTELFKRTIGEVTDIVEKEMYTFDDRNGDSLTLRPEGTASCVRAALEHGLIYRQIQRLWYLGPMFRHERPQRGRYRQFYQLGVEAFGMDSAEIDVELILINARLWQALGIDNLFRLELNSLGTSESRQTYRDALVQYFTKFESDLDADSQRRLHTNPLRILDSKNPDMLSLIADAPLLTDYLTAEATAHFASVCELLDSVGLSYTINPRLVRGLDYYSHTVFEWIMAGRGMQNTVSAGGRFDALIEQLGGQPGFGVGFALGVERLIEAMQEAHPDQDHTPPLHVYFIHAGVAARSQALILSLHLRETFPGLRLVTHCGEGSFKSQMKKADKSGALFALIIGEDEAAEKTVTIKSLREDQAQHTVTQADCPAIIARDVLKRKL